jgi:D-threo-aldose 1-dehydrogenase
MTELPTHPLGLPPRFGFGASGLGNLGRTVSEAECRATLEAAWDGGFRYYDTSPLYGHGLSELRLGAFLRERPRDAFVLSTKVGRYLVPPRGQPVDPGLWQPPSGLLPVTDYSYDATMRALEQSHSRLGLARIDIAYIHDIDRRSQGDAFAANYRTAIEGAYKALDSLRRSGDLRAIGIGVNESDVAADFMRDTDLDLVMLAGRFTLLEQGALNDCLPGALRRGVGIVAAGVYNSGILAKGPSATYDYGEAPPELVVRAEGLHAICAQHGVALAAAAAQFPFRHPAVRSVVLGMSRPESVTRSIANLATPIPDALWADLRAEGFVAAGEFGVRAEP